MSKEKSTMGLINYFCLVLFLSIISIEAFPTDTTGSNGSPTNFFKSENKQRTTTSNGSKQSPRFNASSLMTTSSLLFKDTKPILTYLLGQPKKQGSLSSPAHLLSPDRYEFFTFDDDGQIVKKLMSVKEIQKIIANTEKSFTGEHGTPIEYYQILSVTPDVESIPSVSRINPNEPLFSIHDVIASVQNVLKSEINIKQSQLKLDNAEQYETLKGKPDVSYLGPNQKVTSSLGSESVFLKKLQTSSTEANQGIPDPETRQADQQFFGSFSQREDGTESREGDESLSEGDALSSKTTNDEISLSSSQGQDAVTFTKSSKPVPTTSMPLSTFVLMQEKTVAPGSGDTATVKTVIVPMTNGETIPLSLSDAHPAILSNDSWPLDMEPFTFTQNWRIEETDADEVSPNNTSQDSNEEAKLETVEDDSKRQTESQFSGVPETETSTTGDQISIAPDLANSVSSVLWQIVSENAMLENASKSTDVPEVQTTKDQLSESFETSESKNPGQQDTASLVSGDSTSSQNSETQDRTEENPFTVLETILRNQAKPTSIRPLSPNEKVTTSQEETKTEEVSTSSAPENKVELISERINDETSTETKETETTSESQETVSSAADSQTKDKNAENVETSSSTDSSTFVVTLSPDVVYQSPEQLKPTTDKVASLTSSQNNATDEAEQAVDVQISPEANAGHIPRTTEFPGQVVKDVQRDEAVDSEFAKEEPLEEPENDVSTTTQFQVSSTESTTLTERIEPKEEEYVETFGSENLQQSTGTGAKEETEQQSVSSTEGVDITFVPMVIKTSTQAKNETEPEEIQEDKLEVREQAEAAEEGPSSVAPTEEKEDELESKKLPDGESDLPSNQPVTTTLVKDKNKVVSDAPSSNVGEEPSIELKHNVATKQSTSGKPQSPGFTKPSKGKPQADSKPSKPVSSSKPSIKEPAKGSAESKKPYENHLQSSPSLLELEAAPPENLGLEKTVANLDEDIKRFSELCNELAFSLWSSVTHNGLSFVRSLVVSPFAVTSLLAMVFLGARGPTSGQMNDVLKLDDMVTFNPHLVFRNVTESLIISRNPGVATAAFVRELYSDKSKGKLLDFYKERAQQFYDGHVEEINFKTVGDTIRRQTNHLVKRQTWGKMTDFMRTSNLIPKPPLAAFGANIFQTDCSKASIKDRDGEMYFVILPASRLRRLVPIPAAVWRSDFLAGYEPQLDATAVSIGSPNAVVSTIFVLPGQQGLIAPGDTLARLEHHLLGSPYRKGHWTRLMKSLLPRPGLELQIPRISHKSVVNVTSSLQRMGLKDLFSADKADLTGLNGLANDLHLSDMLQINLFSTCGEEPVGARHHSEVYPATPILRREKSFDGVSSDSVDNLFAVSDFEDPVVSALPLELRPRQARLPLSKPGAKIPEPPRLRFDRPFLFFVRHNPTGLILHMGRFNPRLTP